MIFIRLLDKDKFGYNFDRIGTSASDGLTMPYKVGVQYTLG